MTTAERELWCLSRAERDHAFAALPERRRDIKALQIEGFSYEEIAEMRGLTRTRVNHLLIEAHAKLREYQGRSASSSIGRPPRAVRLEELEQDPPIWLRRAIGLAVALLSVDRSDHAAVGGVNGSAANGAVSTCAGCRSGAAVDLSQ